MPPRYLLVLLFFVIFLVTIIQLELLSIAFQKLGLTPRGELLLVLGADVLHLADIRTMGVRVASIGGAGTFDGVFLTGIIAVLLA